MPGIINVGCLAHARRTFVEALKAMPPKKDDKISTTEEGLAFCDKLYAIERYKVRSEESRQVSNDFKAWIKYQASGVMPKSALGKAITYCKRLFSNTPKGANSSAVIYSLVESAKGNGVNPFPYLTHLI